MQQKWIVGWFGACLSAVTMVTCMSLTGCCKWEVYVCSNCHNKVPGTGGLKAQTCFHRLEY